MGRVAPLTQRLLARLWPFLGSAWVGGAPSAAFPGHMALVTGLLSLVQALPRASCLIRQLTGGSKPLQTWRFQLSDPAAEGWGLFYGHFQGHPGSCVNCLFLSQGDL